MTIAVALLLITKASAQGTYLTLGIGYGLPAVPAITATDNSSSSNGTATTYNYKIAHGNGSMGKGTQFGLAYGKMLNENIGLELGVGYLIGSNLTTKDASTSPSYSYSDASTFSATSLRFTPAIRMTTGSGNVRPYLRTGLVIGVGNKAESSTRSSSTFSGVTTTSEMDHSLSGGAAVGFALGLGATFKTGNSSSFFAEFGMIAQSWAPTKSVITKYTSNEVDQLPSMTTRQKETDYVDSYSSVGGVSPDTSVPDKELKQHLPMSSIGINIGWHFVLGGK